MKRALVFWIIAAVLLFAAIGMFIDASANKGAAAVALIGAVVLGVIGFVRYKNKDKVAAIAVEKAENNARAAAARCIHTRAAGVTFENEDGSSRQEILRGSKRKDEYAWETVPGELVKTDYNGAPALRILIGGVCIGSIPKEDLPRVLKNLDKVASVTVTPEEFEDKGRRIMRADVNIYLKD